MATIDASAPVVVFEDDDAGYMAWTKANRRGFVLNTSRPASSNYLMLHWSDCRDISGRWDAWTSGDYLKACAVQVSDLEQWALVTVNGQLQKCTHCWA